MTWLLSTLFWTGLLIAAVLTVRRPVARHFGAKAAYALWLLPLMRLALPPIVLPAWLAPAPESAVSANADTAMWIAVPVDAVPAATPAPFDWQPLLVALWGTGVAAYIAMRLMSYFRLRRDLLTRRARDHEHRHVICPSRAAL